MRYICLYKERASNGFTMVHPAEAPLFIMRLLRLLLIPAAGPYDPAEVSPLRDEFKLRGPQMA